MSTYDPNHIPVKNYFLLGVKLVLLNQKGEILLLERSAKSSSPHSWDFPGGGVDAGESFEEAVKRELKEETTLGLSNLRPIGSVRVLEGEDEALIMGYCATTNDTDITLSWEHESYRWVNLDEVNTLDLRDLHTQILEYYTNKKDS